MPHPARVTGGRYGALRSWGNTPDRTVRTAPARQAAPSSVDYWLNRLDPERFAAATDQQKLDAAEALRKAYFVGLARKSKSSRARRGGPDAPAA